MTEEIKDIPTIQVLAASNLDTEKILQSVDRYVKNLHITEFKEPVVKDDFDLSTLVNCTNDDLERLLLIFGGYRAYLDVQIAYVEARKAFFESSFEDENAKVQHNLLLDAGKQKKTKDYLRGESLIRSPQLGEIKHKLNNLNSLYIRLSGLRNSYKSAYDAVSRVVALRLSSRESL